MTAPGTATSTATPAKLRSPVSATAGLLRFMQRHRWMMTAGLLVNAVNTATGLGTAAVTAYLVGLAVTGASLAEMRPWLIGLPVLVLGRTAMMWLQAWIDHDLAYRLIAELRVALYDALARIAPAYLQTRRTGDLASAATSDAEKLEWFYAHTVATALVALAATPILIAVLILIHPIMAAVVTPTALLVATIPIWLSRIAARQGRELAVQLGTLNADAVDGVQGLRELVSFGAGRRFAARLEERSRTLARAQLAYGRRAGIELAGTDLLTSAGLVIVLATAAVLSARGEIALHLLPLAVVLAIYAYEPITNLVSIARGFGQVTAAAQRVYEILDQPDNVTERTSAAPLRIDAGAPLLSFDGVTFRYPGNTGLVLDGVTFEVGRGETVALVGHSGAGKSTCVHLAMRFWDVDAGVITIDGQDIRSVPLADLRSAVAFVPQDIYLFNVSIRENIRLGRSAASDAEVEDAARQAIIHDFIVALPDGYETVVGERGAFLSGGQRQRIAIARALLRDAPILLMDEAVSSLDVESERQVRIALDTVRRGRTTLVVAHRLSTILAADRIVVLESGRVAETGQHHQLMARDEVYARLIAGQRGGIVGAEPS